MNLHGAFKACSISTDVFLVKLKVELQEIAKEGTAAKAKKTFKIRKVIKAAMGDRNFSMKRTYAAARPAPQRPLTIIKGHRNICVTPGDLDKAYDVILEVIFKEKGGGAAGRLARAPTFLEKYSDLCPVANQFKNPKA